MDLRSFVLLNAVAGWSPFTDALIVFFGAYFIFAVTAIVAALALRRFLRDGEVVSLPSFALLSGVVSLLPAAVLKSLTHRPRPFLVLHVKQLLSDSSYAFPSGHTVFLAAMATAIFVEDRRFGWLLFACALTVGVARIAAGIHWPSDVLGGLLVGGATGTLMRKAFGRDEAPKKGEVVSLLR